MELGDIFDRAAGRMPMVPKVVQELIVSFERADTDVDSVANKVSHDQVLSAKVLRLANSARISGGRAVRSIEDAVVLLGFDNLRLLVVASGVSSMSAPNPSFDRQAFWRRSFQVATVAKWLARFAKIDANTAYTVGLLHNIGELLIHVAFPTESVKIDRLVDSGADRIQVENMVIGLDLTQVGEELAKRWHFPAEIQQAIRQHKNPTAFPNFEPLAGVVALADLLVTEFVNGVDDAGVVDTLPANLLDKLGVSVEVLAANLEKIREQCMTVDDLL